MSHQHRRARWDRPPWVWISAALRPRELPGRGGLLALLVAFAVSSIGEAMTIIALPIFILTTTDSITMTGTVVIASTLSTAIVGLAAGPLVDRMGFRRTLILSYLIGGTAIAGMPILHARGQLGFTEVIVLVVLASALDTPGTAAFTGLVPGLAGRAKVSLEAANSAFQTVGGLTQLLGPAAGGLVIITFSAVAVFWIDAATCIFAAVAIGMFIRPIVTKPVSDKTLLTPSYLQDLRQGISYTWRNPLLKALLWSGIAFNMVEIGFVTVALVSYSVSVLGDAAALGALITSFGLGSVVGSIIYGSVGSAVSRRSVYLSTSVIVAGIIGSLALQPTLLVVVVLMVLGGIATAPVGPLRASVMQQHVPLVLLGRVTSAVRTASVASAPLGIVVVAASIDTIGLPVTLAGLATLYLAVTTVCWASPALYFMDRPIIEADRG